jgi:hypothetical protein
MTDFFGDDDMNSGSGEPGIEITPNIEFQLNKFNDNEYLKEKYIPEKALFASEATIQSFKSFYINNIDIPLLVYGNKGIGKITCILGLLGHIPCYLPEHENDENALDNTNALEKKLNNLNFFKVLDNEFSQLIYYENIYYLNIKVLHNNTEIINYLQYIYKITRTRSFDENEKKIIIISNIDKCNHEAHRYISFMIEKISTQTSYIFTSYTLTLLDKKIVSACAPLKFSYLDEITFCKIFKTNFKKSFTNINKAFLYPQSLKKYYDIYVSNNYNIGSTIAQIKYYLEIDGISFLKDKSKTCSLMTTIAQKFIKKKLILSTVISALEIRKFLYTMISLNIDLITFVQEVVKQLYHTHLHTTIKLKIIEASSHFSKDILNSNKEVIIIETFFYNIINIIYSPITTEIKSI